jgi:hypothetical protein
MKPVFQTIIDSKRGNCLSAGLASVLELPIEQVPNFIADHGEDFQKAVNDWLAPQGLAWLRIIMPREIPATPDHLGRGRHPDSGDELRFHPMPETECLATGKSPRGEWCHTVVGKLVDFNFIMVHDPHPDGTGLDGLPLCIEFLVPLRIK